MEHECKPLIYCTCRIDGLEPNEDCSIHGIPKQPRCSCGKFVKKEKDND